jgi:hypothetical protein
MKNNRPTITPLDKLLADKQRVHLDCDKSSEVLDRDFTFLHENALPILFSSVGYIFFPNKKNKAGNGESHSAEKSGVSAHSRIPLGFSDYLSVARNFVPSLWGIARPMIISWGVSKFQKWLTAKLLNKKRTH